MSIKVTLGEVLMAKDAVLKFEKLPAKASYKLGVLAADLIDQVTIMMNTRNDLIKKYATEKDERGNARISANTPEMADFSREWAELLEQEIEIKMEEKIKLPDTIEVEPAVLFNLRKFVEVV